MRDLPTLKVAEHIDRMGIKISAISRGTGIPDGVLRRSLSTKERDLRAEEFLAVCQFLNKQPFDFYSRNEQSQGRNA